MRLHESEHLMSKLTLQLSPDMDLVLDQLAARRGMKKSQALRRAMLVMQYLDEQIADGKDVVLRDRETGHDAQLVLESQMGQ